MSIVSATVEATEDIHPIPTDTVLGTTTPPIAMKISAAPHAAKTLTKPLRINMISEFVELGIKLIVPDDVWYSIYDIHSHKLIKKKYNHIIAELLSEITSCQINIKTHDMLRESIVIRAYCGVTLKHGQFPIRCERKYILINKNVSHGEFTVHHSPVKLNHPFKKARIISGHKRDELKKTLLKNSVSIVAENLYNNMKLCPPTQDVLRQIRTEALKTQDNDVDDFEDLKMELFLQKQNPETQYIQRLSFEPFNVQTWNNRQFDFENAK